MMASTMSTIRTIVPKPMNMGDIPFRMGWVSPGGVA
jgi:hypothetical protein